MSNIVSVLQQNQNQNKDQDGTDTSETKTKTKTGHLLLQALLFIDIFISPEKHIGYYTIP